MKKLKELRGIVLLLSIFIGGITFAQGPGGGAPGGGQQGPPSVPTSKQIKKMVAEIADEVVLTDEQEELVLAEYKDHFEKVDEMISGSSRPDRDEMMALDALFEKDVKALLTDEQVVKYTAYLEKQKKERERR